MIDILEKIKPLIEDIATTIIIIGDTIPALTAASPNIKPPRIEIEDPILLGILKSVSRSISKQVSNIIHSTKLGKGTLSLWSIKLVSNKDGITSILWVVKLIYIPGKNTAIKKAINLKILTRII